MRCVGRWLRNYNLRELLNRRCLVCALRYSGLCHRPKGVFIRYDLIRVCRLWRCLNARLIFSVVYTGSEALVLLPLSLLRQPSYNRVTDCSHSERSIKRFSRLPVPLCHWLFMQLHLCGHNTHWSCGHSTPTAYTVKPRIETPASTSTNYSDPNMYPEPGVYARAGFYPMLYGIRPLSYRGCELWLKNGKTWKAIICCVCCFFRVSVNDDVVLK